MIVWKTRNNNEIAYYQGNYVGLVSHDENDGYIVAFKTKDEGLITLKNVDTKDKACDILEYAIYQDKTHDEWFNRK